MIDFLENLQNKDKFLEVNFQNYPFQLYHENENLSEKFDSIIKNLDSKEESINTVIDNSCIKGDINSIEIKYKQMTKVIYRYPVVFKLLTEKEDTFKVFEFKQLKDVLLELKIYYSFWMNDKIIYEEDIIKIAENNKLKYDRIILIPNIYMIFKSFRIDKNIEDKIKNNDNFTFDINKEQLDPFFMYIEKKEIKQKNLEIDLLNNKLTFIMNSNRKIFMKKIDDYISIDIQTEPMIIIGNDGVGKSLTLQLYSLLEYEGYKKVYFNLKLLQKCNIRDYFFIELLRGFVPKDRNKDEQYFKDYLNCIKLFQRKIDNVKEFFDVLIEILKNLKFNSEKFVILIDQFDFESITIQQFFDIKSKIPSYEKFKLIICCSLIDNENKKNMFSDYKNYELDKFLAKNKILCTSSKKIYNHSKIDKIQKFSKGTLLNNFNFILNMNKEQNEINNKEIKMNINSNNLMDIKKSIKKENKEDKMNNKKKFLSFEQINNIENKKEEKEERDKNEDEVENPLFKILGSPNFKLNIKIENKTSSHDKLKIYYSNLISIEEMIQEEEINKCMLNFNYIPKYYYKLYLFRIIKQLQGETNISNIINDFYKKEKNDIKKHIDKFYSNFCLNEISKGGNNNSYFNTFQYLLKLKKAIRKTYEFSIPFYKLYEYSQIFPFKYINILTENNEQINIIFDKELESKKFKLRYSFPFVEEVIENILEEYNNDKFINILQLSGSAFGNALEIKIRDNLKEFKEETEIRYVWSLNDISDAVKKEKLSEIKKNKDSSRRFKDFEDITNIKNIISSNYKYFYFKPENQDNKYFDSLFLIKKDNEFIIIAFQITKNREKKNVKSKEKYSDFLINKVKIKFEKLYNISISEIYFWYILDNETKENESLCKILNQENIMYIFYSIDNKCFYKIRDHIKIITINDFTDIKSRIYSINGIQIINKDDIKDDILNPGPGNIKMFEQSLYEDYNKNNNIYFETVRYIFFGDNFGPKIDDNLKNNIINELKNFLPYSNEFKIMFLFSFDFGNYQYFKEISQKYLIYLFKTKGKTYLLYENEYFEIINNKKLIKCEVPNIGFNIFVSVRKRKYHSEEFDFSSIDDLEQNNLIFLFKIYFLGNDLIEK